MDAKGWASELPSSRDIKAMMTKLGMDSQSFVTYKWNPNTTGNIVVEYGNLTNSSYIGNDGQKHHIGKIRVSYQLDPSKYEHGLFLPSDMTDGFGYLNTDGVKATYSIYGDDNQLLNLSSGHAFLTITSLNHHMGDSIESVSIDNGGQAYSFLGSSISKHGNSLYADKVNNFNQPGTTWKGSVNWDQKGPNEYYGAGLIEANTNNFTIHYYCQNIVLNSLAVGLGGGPWATITTDIPQTPGPTPPSSPMNSVVHYHYDEVLCF